jgi:hypothetical protein
VRPSPGACQGPVRFEHEPPAETSLIKLAMSSDDLGRGTRTGDAHADHTGPDQLPGPASAATAPNRRKPRPLNRRPAHWVRLPKDMSR